MRHLRYFVAVAEELSFRSAARRLHMAQPPLSVQVRQLEEELGVRLFQRTSRRVTLTSAGELFLTRARNILRESEAAVYEAKRAGRGELGRLQVGFSGMVPTHHPLLPAVLRRYRAMRPKVILSLHEQRAAQQFEDIEAGRLDLGFMGLARADLDANADHLDLAFECLVAEPLFVALPEDHRLAKLRRVTRHQMSQELLVWDGRQGLFMSEGGLDLTGGLEVNSLSTVFNYVAAGFGVTVVPRQFVGLDMPGISFVPYADAPDFGYGMVWHRAKQEDEPLKGFLTCAREVAPRRR